MFLPTSQEYWQDLVYIAVFPNKRKMSDTDTEPQRVQSKRPMQKCSDLIVLGLPWELNESQLEKYFSKYGELVMTQIKRDENKKSKGYGFIRFSTFEAQKAACRERHNIQDRWCEVKIPHSVASSQHASSPKIFVGRVTEKLTKDDLQEYFSQFGPVHDVYIPTPFRAFAFVTFEDPETAESLIGEDHIIKGTSVLISSPEPKRRRHDQQQQDGGFDHSHSSYNNRDYNSMINSVGGGSRGDGYSGGGRGNYNSRGDGRGGSGRYNSNNGGGGGYHQRHNNHNNGGGYDHGYGSNNFHHGNGGAGPPGGPPGGFNMNPAMLAAAMNSWTSMMSKMNHPNK